MHKQGFHLNLLNLKDKRRMTHFFRDLSLIFGVTSILLLCVYSIICCLTKELMTVFLQNGIFLHHLSFYLLKPDSNRYCGSVMNTDTHMSNRYIFFVHHFKCYLFLPANIQAKNTHTLQESLHISQICFIDISLCYWVHINGYYLSTCLSYSLPLDIYGMQCRTIPPFPPATRSISNLRIKGC